MRFANPQILWLLLLLPFAVGALWMAGRHRVRVLSRFAPPQAIAYLANHYAGGIPLSKQILSITAIAGIIFATARPQWGFEDRHIISRGVDVIVAVDTSSSMLAQDYRPNRLARAKDLLQNVIWTMRGDRIGIMAFAGSAFMQCPLTLDYGMAKTALEALDINSVPVQGTAIGTAIDAAVNAFQVAGSGERVLVLLTDGEDQGTQPIEAAQRAAKEHVRIYTIGIGTSQGMPIPINGGYKQDHEGHVVNSKLDLLTLAKIAQLSGGKAIKANSRGNAELDEILSDLASLQKKEQQDTVYRVYTERFQWFLLPSIVLLALEAMHTGYVKRPRIWKGRMIEAS